MIDGYMQLVKAENNCSGTKQQEEKGNTMLLP